MLPIAYHICYTKARININIMGENFVNPIDMRLLFICCSLISTIFIVIMLCLAEKFSAGLLKKKILVVCILSAHLIVSYCIPQIINYYKFAETGGSLITLIFIILIWGFYYERGNARNDK